MLDIETRFRTTPDAEAMEREGLDEAMEEIKEVVEIAPGAPEVEVFIGKSWN